jgi:hypothetical protein
MTGQGEPVCGYPQHKIVDLGTANRLQADTVLQEDDMGLLVFKKAQELSF